MGANPDFWEKAKKELSKKDPVLRKIIKSHPGKILQARAEGFETLLRSIVGQQISVKAAQSIWLRFTTLCGETSPGRVLEFNIDTLRSCGLSQRKAEYVLDLASHFHTGRISSRGWMSATDEKIIEELCMVRGVGRWTAEMFLIFHLMRPDVFPVDDLGIQRAISLNYKKRYPVSKKVLQKLSLEWQPWRSVASWYLWRSLDPLPKDIF
jgi:DNA-3-methyladenine glycosylase II